METKTTSVELEVLPPSSVMALERAQIDSQIATAHAYPRSLAQFKKRGTEMATLDLPTAESCLYSRPVGDGKIAEGASIRMAEIVAACYGNLRVAARIVEQTDRYVKCEGVAHDLESNYAGKSECVEPTVKRDGKPYSEGQRAVVAKACLAKAYRDAVFKVVPKALCKSIIDSAKGVVKNEIKTIEDRRDRARQWLKQIGVDDKRLFGLLKVNGWTEVTDDHLTMLTGLRTAINDQDTTVEEAFPLPFEKPKIGGETAATTTTSAETPTTPTPAATAEKPKGGGKKKLKIKPEAAAERSEVETIKKKLSEAKHTVAEFLKLAFKHEWLDSPEGFEGTDLELNAIKLESFAVDRLNVILDDFDTVISLLNEGK